MKNYDVIIVGGGVVGCMTARALSRYELSVLLVEKEADIGMGASSANSAVIHAGHDPIPGSLKAQMNLRGNPMWDSLAAELGIPFKRTGAYIVAVDQDECDCLQSLLERGQENKVACEIISGDEMLRREPLINPQVRGALSTPSAGMVDPFAACLAPLENAVSNGVDLLTGTKCLGILREDGRVTGVLTNRGAIACRWVINSAGVFSDEIVRDAGDRSGFKITPRKGEYYVLDKADFQLDNILFPVPTKVSKGILVLGTVHGNAILGPSALDQDDRENKSVTADGLANVWQLAQRLVPSISQRSIIAVFAGLRAAGNAKSSAPGVAYDHDFVIEMSEHLFGLIHLAGIESPGFTAAPAIAERVVEIMIDSGEKLRERKNWNPIRVPRPRFNHLSRREQAELIQRDPRYGRIICRCEMITEGEIIAEIHSAVPARTYDAVKRRTWLGTGRCLGSFDMPRVVELLAQEWGVPVTEITKKGPGSEFLRRETKAMES